MTRTLPAAIAVVVALPLAACGLWPGGEDTPEDASVGDSIAQVVDSAAAPSTPPPITTVLPAQDTTTLELDSLSAEEQIEVLLRSQRETNRRVDSLLSLLARSDGLATQDAEPDTTGAFAAASGVVGQAGQQVRGFTVGIVWSVVVIILFNLLIRLTVWILDRLSERSAKRRLFYKRLVPIVRIVLWVFAAYLIVSVIFQVDYQGIVAAAAAVGVAVGFAAQDLLKNLFGGLILVFDQPFQVGDKISVGGTYGEVVSIGLRSTRMVTADDNLVSVPNAQVVDQQVANANAGELNCQVVTDVYLPGWVDEAKAKRIAFEAAASSKYVYLNKPIAVLIQDQFKETFLTRVRVKAYVLDPRFEFAFQSDVTERARAGFRAAGLVTREQRVHGFVEVGPENGDSASEVAR